MLSVNWQSTFNGLLKAISKFERTEATARQQMQSAGRDAGSVAVTDDGDGRFGGHFVQGHVDAIGAIVSLAPQADAHWMGVSYPAASAALLVEKGSIAVDGVSLTVARLSDSRFEVMIVPFTWRHTRFSAVTVGGHVNLEFDIVGKYVARAIDVRRGQL